MRDFCKQNRSVWVGLWGILVLLTVAACPGSARAQEIVAAEYYIDADPGLGLGTSFVPGPAGETTDTTITIPATGLVPGLHVIATRVQDTDGAWSVPDTRTFRVLADTTNEP
ncbi:hypothetical protein DRQ50_05465, partial [bacterium]